MNELGGEKNYQPQSLNMNFYGFNCSRKQSLSKSQVSAFHQQQRINSKSFHLETEPSSHQKEKILWSSHSNKQKLQNIPKNEVKEEIKDQQSQPLISNHKMMLQSLPVLNEDEIFQSNNLISCHQDFLPLLPLKKEKLPEQYYPKPKLQNSSALICESEPSVFESFSVISYQKTPLSKNSKSPSFCFQYLQPYSSELKKMDRLTGQQRGLGQWKKYQSTSFSSSPSKFSNQSSFYSVLKSNKHQAQSNSPQSDYEALQISPSWSKSQNPQQLLKISPIESKKKQKIIRINGQGSSKLIDEMIINNNDKEEQKINGKRIYVLKKPGKQGSEIRDLKRKELQQVNKNLQSPEKQQDNTKIKSKVFNKRNNSFDADKLLYVSIESEPEHEGNVKMIEKEDEEGNGKYENLVNYYDLKYTNNKSYLNSEISQRNDQRKSKYSKEVFCEFQPWMNVQSQQEQDQNETLSLFFKRSDTQNSKLAN